MTDKRTFNYRAKGTANEDWATGSVEAVSEEDAMNQLQEIYGTQGVEIELVK